MTALEWAPAGVSLTSTPCGRSRTGKSRSRIGCCQLADRRVRFNVPACSGRHAVTQVTQERQGRAKRALGRDAGDALSSPRMQFGQRGHAVLLACQPSAHRTPHPCARVRCATACRSGGLPHQRARACPWAAP